MSSCRALLRFRLGALPGVCALGLSLLLSDAASGQANYSQTFDAVGVVPGGTDGPQALLAQGWIFRNQSGPVATGTWHDGYSNIFGPQSGASYLAVGSESTAFLGGDVSQWAILPAIGGLQALVP